MRNYMLHFSMEKYSKFYVIFQLKFVKTQVGAKKKLLYHVFNARIKEYSVNTLHTVYSNRFYIYSMYVHA